MYNLCFGLSKLYTVIQQDQKAKLDYHMSMLFAYMAGGGEVEVLKCFVRGVRIFLLALCVCVGGGGVGGWVGGGQVQYLSFREKNPTHLLLINDWSLKQKKPQGSLRRLSFFKTLLVYLYFLSVTVVVASVRHAAFGS